MQNPPVHPALWGLVAAIVLVEVALTFLPSIRGPVYTLFSVGLVPPGAVWHSGGAALLFTFGLFGHVFLHLGWVHLAFNVAALLSFGHVVSAQAGIRTMFFVMFASAVVGALAFLAFGGVGRTMMVGASGGVFGLIGMVLCWRRGPVWPAIVVLSVLHLPVFDVLAGPVAWEAHLGGALAGWGLGGLIAPRRRIRHPLA